MLLTHRPAHAWLSELQKAKLDGQTGLKPKITIGDLLEKANDPKAPESQLVPTSPRSVEACFLLGIDPIELQYHPLAFFRKPGDSEQAAQIRYEKHEILRQEKVKALLNKRKDLIENADQPAPRKNMGDSGMGADSSTMVDKEKTRLEVLMRRQERELSQMVQHEITRKELLEKQQKKVEAMERRTQELARQKLQHDVEWIQQQREGNMRRAREEQALEREARKMAEERYRRQQEIIQREKIEERRRKQEAMAREIERRQKSEDARKATEVILTQQADEVQRKRMELEKRDQERLKRLEMEAKERVLLNMEKRKKAEARIQSALYANTEIRQKRKQEYNRREAENEVRRLEMEETRRHQEELKREEERKKERERADKYALAAAREEARKASIRHRKEEKEAVMAEMTTIRRREQDLRKVERDFELQIRLDKVDSMQKMNLYQRQQLYERIMAEYEKARGMMSQKMALQEQRKMANMHASLQRQMLNEVVEKLRNAKDLDKIQTNGVVNVNSLLKTV